MTQKIVAQSLLPACFTCGQMIHLASASGPLLEVNQILSHNEYQVKSRPLHVVNLYECWQDLQGGGKIPIHGSAFIMMFRGCSFSHPRVSGARSLIYDVARISHRVCQLIPRKGKYHKSKI